MTNTELPEELAAIVGARVHGLDPAGIVVLLTVGDDSLYAFPKTTTLMRGQELVLTEQILLASLDRKGNSIWALDEYAQREKFDGVPRWGFDEYPESEKTHDALELVSNKYVNQSQTIAEYRGDSDSRRLHASLRSEW